MIGVFDSGLGGLSALKALKQKSPRADIVYLADTARLPYGSLSPESVFLAAKSALRFFIEMGASSVLFACGTVSALALPRLQEEFSLPLYGVLSPSVSVAKSLYKGNTLGILATNATVQSRSFPLALQKELPEAKLLSVACPLFVSLVENGFADKDNPVSLAAAKYYLSPFFDTKTDALILGCTHFSWLSPVIQRLLPRTPLVDCASIAAASVPALSGRGEKLFFTTQNSSLFSATARFLLKDESVEAKEVSLPL